MVTERPMKNKFVFIICWFGKFPEYFDFWLKSVAYNPRFDFLIITDSEYDKKLPVNVYLKNFSQSEFKKRASDVLNINVNFNKAYRVCDFRPMFGLIFKDYIADYDYWGYCDMDLVFGNLESILSPEEIEKYDAVFNGGHFTLIKRTNRMNTLFTEQGAVFDYKTVVKKDAIFAFDETTGIQQIAIKNNVNALYGITYVDADTRYRQLRSRMDKDNPDYQAYYWENGTLYRVKYEDGVCSYQNIAYIHLQKRKINKLDEYVNDSDSFWIEPDGFANKEKIGLPKKDDILQHNIFPGTRFQNKEKMIYSINKIKTIFARGIYPVYVRIKQQKAGINSKDGKDENIVWVKY